MLYSKSTGGFYTPTIHGDTIPADAVGPLSAEQHAALLSGQCEGKSIGADENGWPVLIDPPLPSTAQIWEAIKAERDRRADTGGYRVAGKWFHSDQKSRNQQLGLVLLGANIPAGLQWKTMDGSFIEMTPALAQQILGAAAASDIALFTAAETHRATMEASAAPPAYDFSGGWPAGFEV